MMRALAFVALIAAAPVAADTFQAPKGCTPYLTVQSANCTVEHHWTCEGDPAGEKWVMEFDANSPVYTGKVDNEAQWLYSFYVQDNEVETLLSPAPDPASLSELFANDVDTYEFYINTPSGKQRVSGFDRLAEKNISIDGETLHRTDYVIEITDDKGDVVYAAKGSEYVSEKYRRYFSGYGDVTAPDAPYAYKASPVQFIYAGEPGYLDNTPKFGCDVQTARHVIQ